MAFLKLLASRLITGSPYMPASADMGTNAAAATIEESTRMLAEAYYLVFE
jgi:hypothetical protein